MSIFRRIIIIGNRKKHRIGLVPFFTIVLLTSFLHGFSSPADALSTETAELKIAEFDFLTPEMFGAAGDGITDDTAALNAAIRKASETCGIVKFDGLKHYRCAKTIQLASDVELNMNGCLITVHEVISFDKDAPAMAYDGFHDIIVRDGVFYSTNSFAIAHAKNVLLDNCTFIKCGGNHFIELCASQNITIRDCRFLGQATEGGAKEMLQLDVCEPSSFRHFSDESSEAYDDTPLDNVLIERCIFTSYRDEERLYPMHCAIGGHVCNKVQNTNLIIRNCVICESDGNGVYINNWDHVLIEGCTIANIAEQAVGMRYSCNDVCIRENMLRNYGSDYAIKAAYAQYAKNGLTISCNFCVPKGNLADIVKCAGLKITDNYCGMNSGEMVQTKDCKNCFIKNNFTFPN